MTITFISWAIRRALALEKSTNQPNMEEARSWIHELMKRKDSNGNRVISPFTEQRAYDLLEQSLRQGYKLSPITRATSSGDMDDSGRHLRAIT